MYCRITSPLENRVSIEGTPSTPKPSAESQKNPDEGRTQETAVPESSKGPKNMSDDAGEPRVLLRSPKSKPSSPRWKKAYFH